MELKKTNFNLMQAPYFRNTLFFLCAIIVLQSCNPDPGPVSRRIKQSNKVYDDNVNGRIANGNIEESTNFFYKSDGTLDYVTVYDDTNSTATLLKEIHFIYLTDKVEARTMHYIDGYQYYEFQFNTRKQITKLVDSLGQGLHFTYANDRITSIRTATLTDTIDLQDVVYDNNGNMVEYQFVYKGNPVMKVGLEYSTDQITDELDTRFYNKNIRFIYIGGLNLVTKLGLNFGLNNKNTLIRRTEYLMPGGSVFNIYNFGYIYNDNQEIIKRSMQFNTDTLFYQFRY